MYEDLQAQAAACLRSGQLTCVTLHDDAKHVGYLQRQMNGDFVLDETTPRNRRAGFHSSTKLDFTAIRAIEPRG